MRIAHVLPWLLRAVWRPDIELDLLDADGKPDYGKVVGFFAFACDVLLIVFGLTPPLGHFIALNSVIFGWVGWRTFLKSKSATAREERQVRDDTRESTQNTNITSHAVSEEYRLEEQRITQAYAEHLSEHGDPETLRADGNDPED